MERLLKAGGVPAVTAEISRVGSSYAKGIYYRELFKQATLTPDQYRQIMMQASSEMHSDYELAQLLIAVADKLPNDESSRAARTSPPPAASVPITNCGASIRRCCAGAR